MCRSAIAALLVTAACVRVEPYTCSNDNECLQSADGRCEITSYCSYPDPSCDSDRRYSALAGPYARQCTDAPIGTSSTDASTSSSDSTTGAMDFPERVTATNTGDPTPRGEVLWHVEYAGNGAGADVFSAVVGIDDEFFVVAGHANLMGTGRDVLIARYGGPEEPEWVTTRDHEGNTDRANDIVRGGEGDLYLAGDFGGQAWVGSWLADGEEDWVTVLGSGSVSALAKGVNSLLLNVGRSSSTNGFAIAHRSWDEPWWSHTLPAATEVRLGAAETHGVQTIIGGHLDGQAYLAVAVEAGIQELARWPNDRDAFAEIQAIAPTADAIFVAGYVTAVDASYQGWVARFDPEGGDPVWEIPYGEGLSHELEGIAIGNAGEVYTVGFAGNAEDLDIWVAQWSPDGDDVWSRTYPELDNGEGKARDLVVMPSGDLVVVGEVAGPAGDLDAIAVRIVP